jgi:D-3-phosphoglycerate dehydrogenase / 2-oxoglutarate reductase
MIMTIYNIQTLNNIAAEGLERLPTDQFSMSNSQADPHAIILRSYTLHEHRFGKNLLAVGRAGAGTNNIPIEQLTAQGIPVFNTPGANANAVKELVLAGMLLACRQICPAWQYVLNLKGDHADFEKQVEEGKKQFAGYELLGRTLGIIGLGAIGVRIANVALALGMRVIGYDPVISVRQAWQLSSSVEQAHHLDDVLKQADFISLHVPLNDQTRGMINLRHFDMMKPEAVLLNFARQGIVDHQSLKNTLEKERLSAYVSDFPHPELLHFPRVISLPHLGASTNESELNCAKMIADEIKDYLLHGNIVNAVNFPDVEMSWSTGSRLAIVNENIPNMVGQISTSIAKHGFNVIDLINKSKGNMAYTLLDIDGDVDESVMMELSCIAGVVRVRRVGFKG